MNALETPPFAGWFSPEVIQSAIRVGAEVRSNPRGDGETLIDYTRRLKALVAHKQPSTAASV